MSGVKITVDTTGAVTGTKNLSKALDDLGKQGIETEKGLKRVSDEAKKKLATDDAAKAAAKLSATLGNLEHSCNTVARAMMTAGERASATNRNMANFSGGADNVTAKMAAMASKIGAVAAAYLAFRQAITAAANSFSAFRDYESALTDMGRVTNESFSSISKTIKGLPAQLGDSTSMMKAYYQVMSAGVTDSAKALDLLTVSAKASKAAHVEQEQTVKGLTKLMAGYDGAIKSAAEASDLLFRIDNLGQTSFAELVPVIGDIAAISSTAGLKFQEMASGMAVLTQTSGSTSEAATKLKAIAIGLYKPTENMEKVIKALGFESGVAMVQQKGLAGALQILKSVSDTAGVSLGKLFESSEALVGIAALSANGWGTYVDTLKKMGQEANETESAFQRWIKTAQSVSDTFDATINKIGIEFGEEIAPIMKQGMQDFVDVVVNNKAQIVATFEGIALAIKAVVDNVISLMNTYQTLVKTLTSGKLSIGSAAAGMSGELSNAMKTSNVLHSDNTGVIPELADIKTGAEDYTKGVSDADKATKELTTTGGKAAEVFNGLNKTAFDPKKIQLAANALGDHDKKLKGAANAAAKYAENANSFYENTARSIEQLQDSLTGGTEKNGNRIDDWFKDQFANISEATKGAKGDVEAYKQAWVLLEQMWPGIKMLAVMKDTSAELRNQAALMKDIADATGDPQLMQQAGTLDVEAWYTERKKQIADLSLAEQDKAKLSEHLESAKAAKMLQVNADAYEGTKAVSNEYWNAEKQLIEANLATVKAHAEDETAYKIYEAQQWDEFYKAQMEQQAATAGSFAETLSAKWSLAFGGYKDETTKTKESWDQMSDSIIQSADGMVDSIAGGFGDMIRNIGNGTASIEDLWKNMLSRMLDMFASFVEQLIKQQLKNLLAGMFSGDDATNSLSSAVSSMSGIRDGGSGSSGGSILSLGKSIGKGVVSAFSSGDTDSSVFIKKLSEAATIEKAAQAASPSGYTALTSGASSAGALATNTASSATSMLSTVGSVLGVVGAIGGIVGIVSSLFGEKKKEVKKTASGYNVGYSSGHATSYGVDFYSDGSVTPTGASDPDVQKKIADSFRNTAEALQDFAEELGFAVDVLEGFEMPNMNVTDDQLDGYIRNGENMMAFKGLMEAGLRGAFDAVARDGEVYVDEYERLATSLSTVRGGLEAYGYELSDVAMITQENIDALRVKNTEVAEGTAAAMTAMATSMGATSDVLSQITSESTHAAAALSVTDEQLSSILEADYASDLLDAIGGEDAFNTMMGNLTKNIFDTIGAYAENLDYYTNKATSAIGKLDESGVTVDNFWEKFDTAIKEGLTVDEFEAWSKASTWVNQIDTVTQAMEDWADGMKKMGQSLEVRKLTALGQEDLAKYTQALYNAEWELADARKAGYDATIIAMLEEVQALELARQAYDLSKKEWTTTQDLNVREKELNNDPYAEAAQAYYDNGWELQEAMESGLYSKADLARLKDIQEREIQAYYDEIAESVTKNSEAAHSRLLRAMGQEDAADLYDAQIAASDALKEALKSNLYSAEGYAELVQAVALETQNLIEQQARDAAAYADGVTSRLMTAKGNTGEAALMDAATQAEADLYEARQKGLEGTQTYADLELALLLERENLVEQQRVETAGRKAELQARLLTAQGMSYEADVVSKLADMEQELADARLAGYDAAELAMLAQVQIAELASQALEQLNQIKADWAGLASRKLAASGDDLNSSWASFLEQQRQEIYQALTTGKSQAYIDELKSVQTAEQGTKWAELLEDAIDEQTAELKSKFSDLIDAFQEAFSSFSDVLDAELSRVNDLASAARSANTAITSTIKSIMYGEDSPLSAAEKALGISGQINTAYQQMTTAGTGAARIDAASTLEDLATEYLSALKSSSTSDEYLAGYVDIMTKLNKAQSVTGGEVNYYERVSDALEAQKGIFELMLEELQKDDPSAEKIQALVNISQGMSGSISGIYEDQTGTGASWRTNVETLLKQAGYSDDDITSALGGPTSTSSFLAQLNKFNTTTMPGYINQILALLNEIKNVAGQLSTPAPTVPAPTVNPGEYPGYTSDKVSWATNLRTAMNSQNYGGSSSWTVDQILPNLANYVGWGSAYGVSNTSAYATPTDLTSQYYYTKTADENKDSKTKYSWLDVQAAVTSNYGSGNVLAHWLDYGYKEGFAFPSSDQVAYKTAQYFLNKWKTTHYGASPLYQAQGIANNMGLSFSNTTASLESIAKKHYDQYGKLEGLIKPYALGGVAGAGSWGLVGEVGPELVRFGSSTAITPANASKNILGEAFADLTAEVRSMKLELYAAARETAKNTQKLAKLADAWDTEGLTVKEATA